ncbi:glycosylated lysosomal membrane protein A-like [Clavelina lepadiformis]|uniref:glycosylated lysosomal membrane protein A-like n=1 Tax=Clavelina lepadiformis TaxID=159417 RepID=UPI004040F282
MYEEMMRFLRFSTGGKTSIGIFFILIVIASNAEGTATLRNVTLEKIDGPGNNSVVYIRSQAEVDCLHYVITTVGPTSPTLLLLKSASNTSRVHIFWDKLLHPNSSVVEGAVHLVDENGKPLPKSPKTSFYIFDELLEYEDLQNSSDITDPKNKNLTSIRLDELSWAANVTGFTAVLQGTDKNSSKFTNTSKVELRFTPFSTKGRRSVLPRMAHNELSADVEFIVDGIAASRPSSRFAVMLVVANPGNSSFLPSVKVTSDSVVEQVSKRIIDDEYAPTIFTFGQIFSKTKQNSATNNFWQWRTVCYVMPHHTNDDATDVKSTTLTGNQTYVAPALLDNKLLQGYFGFSNLQLIEARATIAGFGKEDDGYYNATAYISWTSLVGFGTPPPESFSITVISILIAGVGIPIVIILIGSVFLLKRRFCDESRIRRSQYEPIE